MWIFRISFFKNYKSLNLNYSIEKIPTLILFSKKWETSEQPTSLSLLLKYIMRRETQSANSQIETKKGWGFKLK
jgi:hypothetical protein